MFLFGAVWNTVCCLCCILTAQLFLCFYKLHCRYLLCLPSGKVRHCWTLRLKVTFSSNTKEFLHLVSVQRKRSKGVFYSYKPVPIQHMPVWSSWLLCFFCIFSLTKETSHWTLFSQQHTHKVWCVIEIIEGQTEIPYIKYVEYKSRTCSVLCVFISSSSFVYFVYLWVCLMSLEKEKLRHL